MFKGCLVTHVFLPYPRTVEVDAEFPGLAHIVDIGLVLWAVAYIHFYILVNHSFEGVVSCDGLLCLNRSTLIERAAKIVGETDGVVIVEIITGSYLPAKHGVPEVVGTYLYDVYVIIVCPDVSRYCIVLGMVAVIDHHVSEHFQTARVVFHCGIIIGCPLLIKFYLAICLHADAVALMLLRLYADDRPGFCIVLGTR